MDKEAQRRAAQLDFVQSGQDIIIGDDSSLPLPLAQLQQMRPDSPYVVESFAGGLTAHVYHIRVEGRDWNLKLKREQSLVKNVDGQTSFLNEVQRRRDLQSLKDAPASAQDFKHVVATHYASYQQGLMLSPWIEGELLNTFNERVLTQLFATLVQFELKGLMEWDFCPGNILFDGQDIRLFDFGYCYSFDPLKEFNSNGLSAPLFHSVERLETRNFFAHLLNLEATWSAQEIFSLFELEKNLALQAYQYKLSELKRRGATSTVLSWLEGIIQGWQGALSSKSTLEDLMLIEAYRSHLLDINDDLHGQSCTPMTLKRLDRVESILTHEFELLSRHNGLFFGDEQLSQQQLLARLQAHRQQVMQYQL